VVEEARTRHGGLLTDLSMVVPRAVISGCSEDARDRAELFAVIVSDPARAGAADPLAPHPSR